MCLVSAGSFPSQLWPLSSDQKYLAFSSSMEAMGTMILTKETFQKGGDCWGEREGRGEEVGGARDGQRDAG